MVVWFMVKRKDDSEFKAIIIQLVSIINLKGSTIFSESRMELTSYSLGYK